MKHIGSICFGALIIAIFKAIRIAFGLLEYSTSEKVQSNIVLKLLFKCVHCILWCLEKTVEYISYWGFIFVAVHGTSFCRSCFDAFSFQVKYFSQSVVNTSVQFILKVSHARRVLPAPPKLRRVLLVCRAMARIRVLCGVTASVRPKRTGVRQTGSC